LLKTVLTPLVAIGDVCWPAHYDLEIVLLCQGYVISTGMRLVSGNVSHSNATAVDLK